MKTELKTADTLREVLDTLQNRIDAPGETHTSDLKECWNKVSGVIDAIESARNGPLDHLRQQLEEQEKALKYENKMALNATVANRFSEQLIGLRKAISLIDQLKAEMK